MNRLPKSNAARGGIGCLVLIIAAIVCFIALPTSSKPTTPTAQPQPLLQQVTAAPATEDPTVAPSDTPEAAVEATEAPTAEPTVAQATEPPAPETTVIPPTPEPTAAQASGCVSFNAASADELKRIINVDEDIAQQIVRLRGARPFTGWDDLVDRVSGIGENNVKDIQAQGLGCF